MRLPILRVTLTHSELRLVSYWNGWRYPLLTQVTVDGYWFGRGGVLIVGPLMFWWQVPERFVSAAGADGRG